MRHSYRRFPLLRHVPNYHYFFRCSGVHRPVYFHFRSVHRPKNFRYSDALQLKNRRRSDDSPTKNFRCSDAHFPYDLRCLRLSSHLPNLNRPADLCFVPDLDFAVYPHFRRPDFVIGYLCRCPYYPAYCLLYFRRYLDFAVFVPVRYSFRHF